MEKCLSIQNNIAGGNHDSEHTIVPADMLLTEEMAILVTDTPFDPTVDDRLVNDVVKSVKECHS